MGIPYTTFSAGDSLLATTLNTDFRTLRDGVIELQANESIDASSAPKPFYIASTGEIGLCDANDTDKLNFIGFVKYGENVSIGDFTKCITGEGAIVGGFSGLSKGNKYYIQDAIGTIGTTPGTYDILVGTAISLTEIVIQKEKLSRYYTVAEDSSHNFDAGSDTHDVVITCGFRPKFIELFGGITVSGAAPPTYQHNLYWAVNNIFAPVWYNIPLNSYYGMLTNNNKIIIADSTTYLFGTTNGAGENIYLTITNITDTGFSLHFAKDGVDSWTFLWQFLIKVSN